MDQNGVTNDIKQESDIVELKLSLTNNRTIEDGDSTIETSKSNTKVRSTKKSDSEYIGTIVKDEVEFVKTGGKKAKKSSPNKIPSPRKVNNIKSDNIFKTLDSKAQASMRKDINGNFIDKKVKKHKVSFLDQINVDKQPKKNLVDVQEIDNYKAYNKEAVRFGNSLKNEDQANTNCTCACAIF